MTAELIKSSNEFDRQRVDQPASGEEGSQKAEPGRPSCGGRPLVEGEDRNHQNERDQECQQGLWYTKLRVHKDSSFATTVECLFLALMFLNAAFGIAFAGAYVLACALFWPAFRWLQPVLYADDQLNVLIRGRLVLALAGILLSTPLPGPLVHYGIFPAQMDFGGILVALITGTLCAWADRAEQEARV